MQNIIHALTQTRSHSTIIFKLSTKLNIKCMQNLGTYKNCIINLMTKSSNINQFGYKIPEANCVCVSPVEFLISNKWPWYHQGSYGNQIRYMLFGGYSLSLMLSPPDNRIVDITDSLKMYLMVRQSEGCQLLRVSRLHFFHRSLINIIFLIFYILPGKCGSRPL